MLEDYGCIDPRYLSGPALRYLELSDIDRPNNGRSLCLERIDLMDHVLAKGVFSSVSVDSMFIIIPRGCFHAASFP